MKFGVGVLFVAIGLVLLWAAVTGRLSNLSAAWQVFKGQAMSGGTMVTPQSGPAPNGTPSAQQASLSRALNVPSFPTLPVFPFVTSSSN